MSSFTHKDYNRLDYRLLQNSSVNLYWSAKILSEDLSWLKATGYVVHTFDCETWTDEKVIHDSFAKQLEFPRYYGANLDALNDCLGDLAIPDDSGLCIVFKRFDVVTARIPKASHNILDILECNSRKHLLFGRRLIVLAQSNDPKLSFAPIGAIAVSWNPKEFLNKSRGL